MIWCALIGLFRSRAALEAEILVLRHQLNVLRRKSPKRLAFGNIDHLVFAGGEAISWGTYTAPIDYFEADFATASLSRFITSSPHALANGRSDVLMVRSPTFCTNLMTISS